MIKSRKVAGYVKVVRKWEALDRKATILHADMMRRRAALTGGQLAEAQRVLMAIPLTERSDT